MAESLRWPLRTAGRSYTVRALRDRDAIRVLLERERLFAAYPLAQLESAAFPLAQWWLIDDPVAPALVCHSRAGLGEAAFMQGPPEAVGAILSIHPGPFRTFATCKPAHLPALHDAYALSGSRVMRRMHLRIDRFQPQTQVRPGCSIVRLTGRQTRELNRLYGSESGPTSYYPHHIDEGCYYGVVYEGRMVAVAGTHAISPTHGIAVVGNVFTHPTFRGQGFASLATSATSAALLEYCPDVVLSVNETNLAAVHAYQRLGFVDAGEIVEVSARRRGGGLLASARRLMAGYRGRRSDAEIVRR